MSYLSCLISKTFTILLLLILKCCYVKSEDESNIGVYWLNTSGTRQEQFLCFENFKVYYYFIDITLLYKCNGTEGDERDH